jgi:hypothetical protein
VADPLAEISHRIGSDMISRTGLRDAGMAACYSATAWFELGHGKHSRQASAQWSSRILIDRRAATNLVNADGAIRPDHLYHDLHAIRPPGSPIRPTVAPPRSGWSQVDLPGACRRFRQCVAPDCLRRLTNGRQEAWLAPVLGDAGGGAATDVFGAAGARGFTGVGTETE